MEGAVNWPQLIFITGTMVVVSGFMFAFAWRAQEIRRKDRHDQQAIFKQEIASTHSLIELVQKDLDSRLRAIEMANAGTLVMLKHIEDFKKEVMDKFDALERTREKNNEVLNRRLDAIHNAARMFNVEDRDQQ